MSQLQSSWLSAHSLPPFFFSYKDKCNVYFHKECNAIIRLGKQLKYITKNLILKSSFTHWGHLSCLQCHFCYKCFKDKYFWEWEEPDSLMNLACKFARQIQPLFTSLSLLVKSMCIGLVWRKRRKQKKGKHAKRKEDGGNMDLEQYEELAAEVRRAVYTSVSVSITPVPHLPWKYIP